MEKEWRSPRRIEEDVKQYRYTRFETYMKRVDDNEFTLDVAIAALRKEIDNEVDLSAYQKEKNGIQ